MKRVGLITIFDEINFGNRLQNYALSYVLNKKLNCKCITLVSDPNKSLVFFIKQKIVFAVSKTKIKKYITSNPIDWKYWKFVEFDKKYIPIKYYYGTYSIPSAENKKFDYFLVGSDQVWNYNLPGRFGSFAKHLNDYFLLFAESGKKVSYAVSFGVNEIEEIWKNDYKKYLSDFQQLSVRENEGANIINQLLVDKKVNVHIDPTFLLSSKEWKMVMNKPNMTYEKYAFVYFLGNSDSTKYVSIEKMIRNSGIDIIDIMDENNINYFATGPSEFLWLINYSELIFTDSFHATVFSIIFDKPFVVFDRPGMNSRLRTLLKKLHLESRMVENISYDNLYYNNYSEAKQIIHDEMKVSMSYLREVLV